MTKDLFDALLQEFKNDLPDSEYAERQTTKKKDNCSKNKMDMGYFGITLTSPE